MNKMESKQCDVLIVGGGVSGMAAAIIAARQDMSTLLLEKRNTLGGTIAQCSQQYVCGLYGTSEQKEPELLNNGFVQEVCGLLRHEFPNKVPVRMGKLYVLPVVEKALLGVFLSILERESKVDVFSASSVEDVNVQDHCIRSVFVSTPDGDICIQPKVVIDCSGEGIIIVKSGAAHTAPAIHDRQLAGFTVVIDGIVTTNEMFEVRVPHCFRKQVDAGVLHHYARFTLFSSAEKKGQGILKINIPPEGKNLVEKQSTLKIAYSIYDVLRSEIPEFANANIVQVSEDIIARDGISIKGQYILTADDVLRGKHFEDGIVRNAWPIEFWKQDTGPYYKYLKQGLYYEIPRRCLQSINVNNLFASGKCISATPEALASTRVSGTCIALGEQSALAAVSAINARKT